MLVTLKHKKVVEKFVKNLFYGETHSFIEWTNVVGAQWNVYQCVPTTYVTEIKETYVHWHSSFKHLKLPISHYIWQIN